MVPKLPLDAATILEAAAIVGTIFVVSICIGRRYFSPLSDIPGPFVASFSTSLWQLWHILNGHTEAAVIALHQKHGICFTSYIRLLADQYRQIRPYWTKRNQCLRPFGDSRYSHVAYEQSMDDAASCSL
jgi:hypothetical protein